MSTTTRLLPLPVYMVAPNSDGRVPLPKQSKHRLIEIQILPFFFSCFISMAASSVIHTRFKIFSLFFLFFHCFIAPSTSQTTFPQNIQTFFPSTSPPPPPPPATAPSPHTSRRPIVVAVLVTAAATAVLAGAVFFLCSKCMSARRRRQQQTRTDTAVLNTAPAGAESGFVRFDGNIKGLVVDENGLDVLYWKKLQISNSSSNGKRQSSFQRENVAVDRGNHNRNNGRMMSFPRARSSTSDGARQVHPEPVMEEDRSMNARESREVMMTNFQSLAKNGDQTTISVVSASIDGPTPRSPSPPPGAAAFAFSSSSSSSSEEKNLLQAPSPTTRPSAPPLPPPPAAAAAPSPPLPPPPTLLKSNPPPPPPPPPPAAAAAPRPPLPTLLKSNPPPPPPAAAAAPPPPPPPLLKSNPAPPPPLRTQAVPKRATGKENGSMSGQGESNDQVKLKPLHWEKVSVNTEHSMVWNKMERGSFQYNGDMMESLFGYVATNRRSPKASSSSIGTNEAAVGGSNQSAKTFILDSRRSQNIAIVLRSISVPRNVLIDGLIQGRGLSSDTLEKLSRIAPTVEEASQIMAFAGDSARLADAESFLYRLLKAVPPAFTRVDAMHFRSNYSHEIPQLKESLQTVESACNELRNKGVFLKLLEAILKAGNRLNAGTSRGNAKAFNLTTLLKLSDFKSSDGKTTLLHFVVHEVVRNEGRRCMITRNNSLPRGSSGRNTTITTSTSTSTVPKPEDSKSKEEKEREFMKLGLPVVGGVSAELSNVKKAAAIDYDTLVSTIESLESRLSQVRRLVMEEDPSDGGGFVREMKGFLEAAEGELRGLKEDQGRVTDIVKKTIQYYQSGASKDKVSFQLFVIVKDFLGAVDKACIDIARGLQQRKPAGTGDAASRSSTSDALRTSVTFPRLPDHFLSDRSSDSDDESIPCKTFLADSASLRSLNPSSTVTWDLSVDHLIITLHQQLQSNDSKMKRILHRH